MNLIAQIEAEQIAALGKTIPDFKAGDTVRVGYKVTEGSRSRRGKSARIAEVTNYKEKAE